MKFLNSVEPILNNIASLKLTFLLKKRISELLNLTIDELDKVITKYAPEWPLEKITVIDRNILRMGIVELDYIESIPEKVAINEAIELGKAFGGTSSGFDSS